MSWILKVETFIFILTEFASISTCIKYARWSVKNHYAPEHISTQMSQLFAICYFESIIKTMRIIICENFKKIFQYIIQL